MRAASRSERLNFPISNSTISSCEFKSASNFCFSSSSFERLVRLFSSSIILAFKSALRVTHVCKLEYASEATALVFCRFVTSIRSRLIIFSRSMFSCCILVNIPDLYSPVKGWMQSGHLLSSANWTTLFWSVCKLREVASCSAFKLLILSSNPAKQEPNCSMGWLTGNPACSSLPKHIFVWESNEFWRWHKLSTMLFLPSMRWLSDAKVLFMLVMLAFNLVSLRLSSSTASFLSSNCLSLEFASSNTLLAIAIFCVEFSKSISKSVNSSPALLYSLLIFSKPLTSGSFSKTLFSVS